MVDGKPLVQVQTFGKIRQIIQILYTQIWFFTDTPNWTSWSLTSALLVTWAPDWNLRYELMDKYNSSMSKMHKEKDFGPDPDLTKCPGSGVCEYLVWIRKISWPVGIVFRNGCVLFRSVVLHWGEGGQAAYFRRIQQGSQPIISLVFWIRVRIFGSHGYGCGSRSS